MMCESCKQNPATVHLTNLYHHGNTKKEVHLCEDCAEDQGLSMNVQPQSVSEVIGNFLEPASGREIQDLLDQKCPCCGITYPEFRSRGRLGCCNDYKVFRAGLEPLLEKIHGKKQHVGKVPSAVGKEVEREKTLRQLRLDLDQAVKLEAYERAAEIRDRIRILESGGEADLGDADLESGEARGEDAPPSEDPREDESGHGA